MPAEVALVILAAVAIDALSRSDLAARFVGGDLGGVAVDA